MSAGGRPNGDEAILLALACGATYAVAAQQAGVCERTVRRRLEDPGFVARLRQLRGEMLERASGALVAAAMKSVQTLLSLQDGSQPPAVRLGAARAVLELGPHQGPGRSADGGRGRQEAGPGQAGLAGVTGRVRHGERGGGS